MSARWLDSVLTRALSGLNAQPHRSSSQEMRVEGVVPGEVAEAGSEPWPSDLCIGEGRQFRTPPGRGL